MAFAEKLENIYKMLLGAVIAFGFCRFVWGVENAQYALHICNLGWVGCFFWARHLRSKEAIA